MVQAMVTPRRVVLLSLALCWTVSVSPGQAQEAEKAFYAGKTVRTVSYTHLTLPTNREV